MVEVVAQGKVYLLAGSETELKEEFLNNLKSGIFAGKSAPADYHFFYAYEILQLSSILGTAYTHPLIASKRVIVIKNIEQLKEIDKESLLKYLHHPSSSCILVLETSLNDLKGGFWEKLSQAAQVHYFRPQQKKDTFNWILKEVKKQGKHISWPAAQLLQEKIGGDLASLKKAIEQLALYAYQRKEITKEEVELLAGKDYLNSTFDLLKAVNQRETNRAIEILNGLWTEKKSGNEILGLLTWHFRRLLKIKQLADKYSFDQLSERLNIRNNFQLEMLLKESRNFALGRFEPIFKLLTQADLSLRSHRNLEKYILEFLLVKLCQKEQGELLTT